MSPTTLSARRLQWLDEQLRDWTADGLLRPGQASAIRSRYDADTRSHVMRLLVGLGATFLGVGLLWLVAANVSYGDLSPAMRFAVVTVPWIGCTVAGANVRRLRGPLLLLAALSFGGVVFQAAQSLNLPANNPWLLAAWAVGALALAYGTRSTGPLVVGVTAGVGCYVWTLIAADIGSASVVLGLALATPVLTAAAVAQRDERFAAPWLRMAAVTGLLALFVGTIPGVTSGEPASRPVLLGVAGALVAVLAGVLVATWRGGRRNLAELGGAVALAAAAWVVVATAPHQSFFDAASLTGTELLRAVLTSAVFVAAAVGVAATGAARRMPGLVNLAAAALVLFVTLQSFGLFAPLLSGAALFLVVGTLLVGSSLVADRLRRRVRNEMTA